MDWGFYPRCTIFWGGKAAAATAGATEILFDAVNSGCAVWFWLARFYFCASQHSLRNPHATSETAQKLQLTWNSSAFRRCKLFFKRLPKKEKKKNNPTTNRKVAALLKFLCLSNQSGDWEECCGAAAWKLHAGSHNLGRVIYCEPHLEKRHQVEFKWEEKKNWLMSHRGR